VFEQRAEIPGLCFTEEPGSLRFGQARLEAVT
jgi:tryptophanase